MGEYLPGNLQERLRELREANGFKSREKLAEVIGVNKTTYSRIENGSTKTISSDILLNRLYPRVIRYAREYGIRYQRTRTLGRGSQELVFR